MSTKLTVCRPSDTAEQALARMARGKGRRLPVVNRGFEVIGIISLGDIVRNQATKHTEFSNTMAAICAPAKTARTPSRKAAWFQRAEHGMGSMLMSVSQRLIQFKRIAVLTDLGSGSEKIVDYAASLARWYGSELLLAHAYAPEFHALIPPEPLPSWPASGLPPKQDAEAKLKSLIDKLNLRDLAPKAMLRDASIGTILKEVGEYRPSLLVLATHGREGIRKWLVGSIAEEVFRGVQWPVLLLGPSFSKAEAAPQKQFERVLYGTDLSAISVVALQYAAGISHDHEAQLTVLYVEPDPEQGFSFDRAIAQQRLEDWLEDSIDGLSETLVGAHRVVDFGKPEMKIVEAAAEQRADLVVLGARGLGAASRPASHFLGGTAYEVICAASCPVLIVPQPR